MCQLHSNITPASECTLHILLPLHIYLHLQSTQKRRKIVSTLQKSINKAKNQHGKIPVRFIKILITGSAGAGKTSFSNLLLKKKFNKLHNSTNIVNSKRAISIRAQKAALIASTESSQDTIWLEMNVHSEISHLRSVLLTRNSSGLISAKSELFNQFANNARFQSQTSITQRFSGLFQSSVKTSKLQSFDMLVENESTRDLTAHPGEVLNIISILDTGGQPEFIHLLPTVNINPTITFVVHDLSKSLEDQVLVEYSEHGKHIFIPYHLQYSNLDMLKFLFASINDSLERPPSKISQLVTIPGRDDTSYMCCVGTHADKVSYSDIAKIDKILTNLVEKMDSKAAVWQNENGSVLFPIDNTTAGNDFEDPSAEYIRNEIEALASKKDFYELPITWMLLELEIRQVCIKREKAYILFEECVSIASQSKLITDVKQVKSALLYHHLLGVLLYYPDVPGLCDYVIIDHQWLFDKLSQIVCCTFRSSSNIHAVNRLKHSGILSKELLRELKWEDELKDDYFISLLIVMKIITSVPREDGNGEDYFIPFVLPTIASLPAKNEILSQYGYLQGEPLLIQFVSKLLPRGFFCCLIVEILQHLPNGWSHLTSQKYTCHTYSNLITFILPHSYFLSLLDKLSHLEVQIRHEKFQYYEECPIHLSVQDVLACSLEIVCEQLNFNCGRLQYGFHCQCGQSYDEHMAFTTLSPPFDYAFCSYGSLASLKLRHTHKVWLTEVNFYSHYCA